MKLSFDLSSLTQSQVEAGSYDLVAVMSAISIHDEEKPPQVVEVNDVEYSLAGRVVAKDDSSLYWSYWNDGDPAVNLQLWFS